MDTIHRSTVHIVFFRHLILDNQEYLRKNNTRLVEKTYLLTVSSDLVITNYEKYL